MGRIDRVSGRRSFLATVGTATVGSVAGCMEQLRSTLDRAPLKQISLTVKTVPADVNPRTIRIARSLVKNMRLAGIEAEVLPLAEEQLLRDVLVNRDFDVYVARYPAAEDADFIRSALHSSYLEEAGWQNPFGYANLAVDELLDEQRSAPPGERQSTLASLQRAFLEECPFAVVVFPDEPRAIRTGRFDGWFSESIHSKLGYLSLRRSGDDATDDRDDGTDGNGDPDSVNPLRVGIIDDRPTRNRNPLSVEFRDQGILTDLLYDSLGMRIDGQVEPWLARKWTWQTDGDRLTLDVSIREGIHWHDGAPLSADDVAFTYRFLADTSIGEGSVPVPSPRYRGRISLVDSIEVLDRHAIRLRFEPASQAVATRSLTIPIFPQHIWRERTGPADIAGVTLSDNATEALVWNNEEAIGSGPFRFDRANTDTLLALRPFGGHFLRRDDLESPLDRYAGPIPYGELRFVVVPSSGAAIELLESGDLDATAATIAHTDVATVGRSTDLRLSVEVSPSFYHVGYNTRSPPLDNPRFRQVISRLLDRNRVADSIFGGYASGTPAPFARTEQAVSLDQHPDAEDPLPFPEDDGELDVETVRELFQEAGYSYRDGKLVAQ